MQNMVDAIKVLGLFDGGNVGRFFHHADQSQVAGGAAAVHAGIHVGDVVYTDGASRRLAFTSRTTLARALGIVVGRSQDMREREPLRSLLPCLAASWFINRSG